MATWIRTETALPGEGEMVLAVKELRSGRLEICLAHCIRNFPQFDPVTRDRTYGPHWVTGGGNNNVLFWMALPPLPEVSE